MVVMKMKVMSMIMPDDDDYCGGDDDSGGDEDDEDEDDTAGSRRVVQLLEKMTRDWPKETHSKSPKWATAENSSRSSPFSKSSSSSPSSILMSNSTLFYSQIFINFRNGLRKKISSQLRSDQVQIIFITAIPVTMSER